MSFGKCNACALCVETQMKKSKLDVISNLPMILVCISLTFAAWAYGGAEAWAIYLMACMALITLGCTVAVNRHSMLHFASFNLADVLWFLSLISLLVVMAVQSLNASHIYSGIDQGLTAQEYMRLLPATVSRLATLNSLLLLFSYSVLYWTTSRMTKVAGLNLVVGVVVGGSVCMAVLALLQGADRNPYELVGMFLNENSFSAYTNLAFPVALGSARALQQRAKRRGNRSNPGTLLYFCAGILATSVLLSGSRAGAVVTVMILAVWIFLELLDIFGAKRRGKYDWMYIVLPVLPVVGLLFLFGLDIWQTELTKPGSALGPHIATRLSVVQGTWRMFLERPVFGIGAGAFNAAFPYYQDAGVLGFYRHAHNDWVQWLAELGVVGGGLGLVAVIASFFRRAAIGNRREHLSPFIVRGMWLGLAGVGIHAMIDFPFRIPAIAVIVAVWIGVLTHRPAREKKYP